MSNLSENVEYKTDLNIAEIIKYA